MIPDEEVERVRESADIVSVISEFVDLRRTGTDYRGPCPFHQGTHRNFSVSPKKRMYRCFVCNAGGDVFHFLQQRLGVDFPESVRLVAGRSGMEVREVHSRQREGPDPREPLWEANSAALEYFSRILWHDPLGAPAREYLESRGITRDISERFALGFAPREIGLMRSYLASLGIDDVRQLEAGLMARREEGDEPRPRFRGRLIFPIHDSSGRIAGFGGRLLGPGEPKYLNSGESAVYSKGKLLYNLYLAKNASRREDRLLLVEGYFDVMRLVAAGVETVVAPLGTALTTDQAALVARFTKNVFLLYDSDKAGLKATFRAGDEFLAHGATARVVTLPEGEDPDTFVRKHGREALEREIAAAIDVFERKVQLLRRSGWFDDLHKRRAAIDRLLPTIRATTDPILRDLYIGQASEVSRVDRQVLLEEVSRGQGDPSGGRHVRQSEPDRHAPAERASVAPPAPSRRVARPTRRRSDPGDSAERELLNAMLQSQSALERVLGRVGDESFRNPAYAEILAAIRKLGSADDLTTLAQRLSAMAVTTLEGISANPESIDDLDQTVEDSLVRLDERPLQDRNAEIDSLIVLASDEEKNQLMREKQKISAQLRELHAVRYRQ